MAAAALLGLRGRRLLQLEVEIHFGKTPLHAPCLCGFGIVDEADVADQTIARGVSEVVPEVLVASQVDLRGQVTMARRGDEEMNVRRRWP